MKTPKYTVIREYHRFFFYEWTNYHNILAFSRTGA